MTVCAHKGDKMTDVKYAGFQVHFTMLRSHASPSSLHVAGQHQSSN